MRDGLKLLVVLLAFPFLFWIPFAIPLLMIALKCPCSYGRLPPTR